VGFGVYGVEDRVWGLRVESLGIEVWGLGGWHEDSIPPRLFLGFGMARGGGVGVLSLPPEKERE
jgi:hypothetical protein